LKILRTIGLIPFTTIHWLILNERSRWKKWRVWPISALILSAGILNQEPERLTLNLSVKSEWAMLASY